MSAEELIRSFVTGLIALTLAWVIWDRSDRELSPENSDGQRYTPYVPNSLLPTLVCFILIAGFVVKNLDQTLEVLLSCCLGIFLHTSIYYLLLMLTISFFRKFISARSCATLWLLPNYLYLMLHNAMKLDRPAWVVPVSRTFLFVFCVIWLAGFAILMVRSFVSHLALRHRLLKRATPVTDPQILELWQQIQRSAGYEKAPYRLVTSDQVTTPLSIGFWRRTIRVILPQREYAPDELQLIFRHEIIHIGRDDSGTKFFFAFCNAMCWFNPLMWMATRRSADDLELSCDETVLLEADEAQRRQYANLLLRTAGESAGFTTCLSASAQALRYRLQNIVKPRQRFNGTLVVALIFFLLTVSCGYFSLSYAAGTGEELAFDGQDPTLCTISSINFDTPEDMVYATCSDPEALYRYVAGLDLYTLLGNYSFSNDEYRMITVLQGPQGAFGITITDHTLLVSPLYDNSPDTAKYYLREPIDWAYVETLLNTD